MMQLKAVVAAIAVAFAGAAFAQKADKPMDSKDADGKLSKKEAANVSRSETSGFAKLDKNKDGYISQAEAKGNAELAKNFAKWDMNNDGKVNRAEYLAAMAKVDASRVVDKVKDPAATGSTSDKPKQ